MMINLEEHMKKKKKVKNKILIFILIILLLLAVVACSYIYLEDFRATTKGIVMKVNENSLSIMELDGGLCSVSFAKEGNIGFKQGQEVLIYFDGMIAESYPAQIHKVGKIKILKEKSDVAIPENILRYYNSSRANVTASISEFNLDEISLTIKDMNEYKYNYASDYSIYRKIKNKDYTGVGYMIGEKTKNSTPAYIGPGPEYIWEEVDKVSNTLIKKDTITSENIEKDKLKNTYNFSKIYGNLGSGEYYFILSVGDLGFSCIRIDFIIKEKGEISYSKPIVE